MEGITTNLPGNCTLFMMEKSESVEQVTVDPPSAMQTDPSAASSAHDDMEGKWRLPTAKSIEFRRLAWVYGIR